MRFSLLCLLCFSWFLATAESSAEESPRRPNFILILIDDMAWNGSSIRMDDAMVNSGMPFLKMPNLGKFASEGMRFRNAYAGAPQCAPSRVAIQTGQSSARNGFTVYLSGMNTYPEKDLNFPYFFQRKDLSLLPLKTCVSDLNLDREEITIAEALKPLGYVSAHFGKWHMRGAGPGDHGYAEHDGDSDNKPGNQRIADDPKLMFSITRKSVDFMERQTEAKNPFYLQISHYAIHAGSECLPATEKKYAALPAIRNAVGEDGQPMRIKQREQLAKNFGMTEDLDTTIGTVMQKVKALGIDDNTYVMIVSDNGYRHWTADREQPLRGAKWWIWDGGLRVPMFVRGPGVGGCSVCDVNVSHCDFLPTFVDLAGGSLKRLTNLDGVSLKSLLRGAKGAGKFKDRPLYFHYPHYRTSLPGSAMVKGNWKVVHWYETPDLPLLFDTQADIGESKNLAAEHPEIHARLHGELTAYLKRVEARIPEPNPEADADKYIEVYGGDPKRQKELEEKNRWRWPPPGK